MTTSATEHPVRPRLEAGVFATVDEARRAVYELLRAGFHKDQITVVCSDETKERYFREFEHQDPAGTHTPAATLAGGTLGAVVGGLTVILAAAGTGSLALWAAGPITAWAGGVTGGLIGAMMTRGVEKELANYYQQAVAQGQILVAAEEMENNNLAGAARQPSLATAARILANSGAKPLELPEG